MGSERDGEALKQAQATWMGANAIDLSPENVAAFKQAASAQIESAAQVIADNGFADQARKLQGLAGYTKPDQATTLTPYEVIGKMAADMTSENNFRTDTEAQAIHNFSASDFSFDNINDAIAHETQLHRLAQLVKPNTDDNGNDLAQDSSGNVYDPNQDDGPGGQ